MQSPDASEWEEWMMWNATLWHSEKLFPAILSVSPVTSYKISIFLQRCPQTLIFTELGGRDGNKTLSKHLSLTFKCLTYNNNYWYPVKTYLHIIHEIYCQNWPPQDIAQSSRGSMRTNNGVVILSWQRPLMKVQKGVAEWAEHLENTLQYLRGTDMLRNQHFVQVRDEERVHATGIQY